MIKSGIIPPLDKRDGSLIVQKLLNYGFLVALTVVLLGFGLEFYSQSLKSPPDQVIIVSGDNPTVMPNNTGVMHFPNANTDDQKINKVDTEKEEGN